MPAPLIRYSKQTCCPNVEHDYRRLRAHPPPLTYCSPAKTTSVTMPVMSARHLEAFNLRAALCWQRVRADAAAHPQLVLGLAWHTWLRLRRRALLRARQDTD